MKQPGITSVKMTQTRSKRFIRKHLLEGREAFDLVIKSVPFEGDGNKTQSIECEFQPVVVDRTLYFTKKSVMSEIKRLLSEGEKRYPNSVVVKVMTH